MVQKRAGRCVQRVYSECAIVGVSWEWEGDEGEQDRTVSPKFMWCKPVTKIVRRIEQSVVWRKAAMPGTSTTP